jgi:chromosome segregation ATPase
VVLTAFLVGLVIALGATVVASVRGVRFWRQAKRTGNTLTEELASFDERAAVAERRLGEWERSSADLEHALERLRRSRARLQVLLDAIDRAKERTRWLHVLVPR